MFCCVVAWLTTWLVSCSACIILLGASLGVTRPRQDPRRRLFDRIHTTYFLIFFVKCNFIYEECLGLMRNRQYILTLHGFRPIAFVLPSVAKRLRQEHVIVSAARVVSRCWDLAQPVSVHTWSYSLSRNPSDTLIHMLKPHPPSGYWEVESEPGRLR